MSLCQLYPHQGLLHIQSYVYVCIRGGVVSEIISGIKHHIIQSFYFFTVQTIYEYT